MNIEKNLKIFRSNYKKIVTRWTCVNFVRYKSSAEPKNKAYSHTILFPKTNFPARSNNAQTDEIQRKAEFSLLYNWQRENLLGPEFILHDGPPYANGDLHMGHAVNKIIKDIKNRSQVVQGNRVQYIPGWDCHGLPIELKALQKARKTSSKEELSDPINIRKIARTFALEAVEKQKKTFVSWGVMADWDKQYYLTMNKSYVQHQLKHFYHLYEKGLIYRALKPVYWSPSSRTALAEAELEYDPNYKSTEAYVTFPIVRPPDALYDLLGGKQLFAIIWTTTPWTLPANRAIAYNPRLRYSLVAVSRLSADALYLVGSELVDNLRAVLGCDVTTHAEVDGSALSGGLYRGRLQAAGEPPRPLLAGGHVTAARGTALVHTAPAHGPDDYLLAKHHHMAVECNVDEAGCYRNVHPALDGLPVLEAGSTASLQLHGADVIARGTLTHAYPLDWRTRRPVLLRASRQWFIDTATLKDDAKAAIDQLEFLPAASAAQSRAGFRSQVDKRAYWCISRQRAWGVPIPAFYSDGEPVVDDRVVSHLCSLIERHDTGADVWWTAPAHELFPAAVARERGLDVSKLTKGKDIMDIWFDSGVSWSVLPPASDKPATLSCEGVDQLTGWFQASLLTALPAGRAAPSRSIFVHGFVVDEQKRKMSKSVGNVMDPAAVVSGGYGLDTLRWWVASHGTQHTQITISKKLLDECHAEVSRVRHILKYLLGVISDLDKEHFNIKPVLNYFDEYMVKESHDFLKNINECYNSYKFNSATQNALYFISNKVSGLYCHCVKDRLYCAARDSNERLSAQLVVHTILTVLCKSLGPILPHLIEEAWEHHPLKERPFFFTRDIPILTPKNIDSGLMDKVLEIKKDVCVSAKNENLKTLCANIQLEKGLFQKLDRLNAMDTFNDSALTEILELSSVRVEEADCAGAEWLVQLAGPLPGRSQCRRCRKYNALDCSDKCLRCENVLLAYV